MTYCEYVKNLPDWDLNKIYHDTAYGFIVKNDSELFERLVLEINQAGLSWTTILKKQKNFKKAYSNFNIKKVAEYTQKDIDRLLSNTGIIRNKLKINAAIYNANVILNLKKEHGSFLNWLNKNKNLALDDWVKLFKKNFKFVGGQIVNEFLVSTAYLPGAHSKNCPIYKKTLVKA